MKKIIVAKKIDCLLAGRGHGRELIQIPTTSIFLTGPNSNKRIYLNNLKIDNGYNGYLSIPAPFSAIEELGLTFLNKHIIIKGKTHIPSRRYKGADLTFEDSINGTKFTASISYVAVSETSDLTHSSLGLMGIEAAEVHFNKDNNEAFITYADISYEFSGDHASDDEELD